MDFVVFVVESLLFLRHTRMTTTQKVEVIADALHAVARTKNQQSPTLTILIEATLADLVEVLIRNDKTGAFGEPRPVRCLPILCS
jgi:hypothetical protein